MRKKGGSARYKTTELRAEEDLRDGKHSLMYRKRNSVTLYSPNVVAIRRTLKGALQLLINRYG